MILLILLFAVVTLALLLPANARAQATKGKNPQAIVAYYAGKPIRYGDIRPSEKQVLEAFSFQHGRKANPKTDGALLRQIRRATERSRLGVKLMDLIKEDLIREHRITATDSEMQAAWKANSGGNRPEGAYQREKTLSNSLDKQPPDIQASVRKSVIRNKVGKIITAKASRVRVPEDTDPMKWDPLTAWWREQLTGPRVKIVDPDYRDLLQGVELIR